MKNAWKSEPVRVTYVLIGFVQAVVTVLLASKVFGETVAAIITGITTAIYAAVSELFLRPDVTPEAHLPAPAALPMPSAEPEPLHAAPDAEPPLGDETYHSAPGE